MFDGPWVPCLSLARRLCLLIPIAVAEDCARCRPSILRLVLALSAASLWSGFDQSVHGQVVTFSPVVRVIYLVPSDREIRRDYVRHLESVSAMFKLGCAMSSVTTSLSALSRNLSR